MMFPLFLFPIFALAVRSDNNFTPIEVQQEKVEVVNFNQYRVYSNDYYYNGLHFTSSGNFFTLNGTISSSANFPMYIINSTQIISSHYYYLSSDYDLNISYNDGTIHYVNQPVILNGVSFSVYKYFSNQLDEVINFTSFVNVFDLTLMFGVGNEPTIEAFDTWYPVVAYDNVVEKQLLHTGVFETFNDIDVGSQMVYVAYKVVDNYFNYDNVFNFGSLYSWLELSFFNGTAPMGFFVFWHLLIYWLLTSLLWLLFDVLMYVPMLIHRWLDKAALS